MSVLVYDEAPLVPSLIEASAPPLEDHPPELPNETCRICRQAVNAHDFIRPCLCDGRCHRHCLDKTRSLHESNFYQCETCHFHYEMEFEPNEKEKWSPQCKFRCQAATKALLVLALFQALAVFLGFIVIPMFDTHNDRVNWFSKDTSPAFINYGSGLLVILAVIGIAGILKFLVFLFDDEAKWNRRNRRRSSYPTTTICICSGGSGGGNNCHAHHDDDDSKGIGGCFAALILIGILTLFLYVTAWLMETYYDQYKISERYYLARKRRVKDLGEDHVSQGHGAMMMV